MKFVCLFLGLFIFYWQCNGIDSPPPSPDVVPGEQSQLFSPQSPENTPKELTLNPPEIRLSVGQIPYGPPTSSSLSSYFTPSARDNYRTENKEGLQHQIYRIHKKLKILTKSTGIELQTSKLEIASAIIQTIENAPIGSKLLNEKFKIEAFGITDCTILHLIVIFVPSIYDYLELFQLNRLINKVDLNAKCKFKSENDESSFTPLDIAILNYKLKRDCLFLTELDTQMLSFNKKIVCLLFSNKAEYSEALRSELDEILGLNAPSTTQSTPPTQKHCSQFNCCSIT